jgi:hypothetical protein
MTPFEINLQHELDAEFVRMANEWFFKWFNISGEHNRIVDVPTFFGNNFHTAGIVFEGQIQELYWRSVQKYLTDKIHETLRRWDEVTKEYTLDLRGESLKRTGEILCNFSERIISHGVDIDRRLRGRGFPKNVPEYNADRQRSTINAQIIRLEQSYNNLIPKIKHQRNVKFTIIDKFKIWTESWRSVVGFFALLFAVGFGLFRIFFG